MFIMDRLFVFKANNRTINDLLTLELITNNKYLIYLRNKIKIT